MDDLSRFFRALGDETRLHLVALLARQEPGRALCVGRLARELEVTPSAVSQHLRVLKDLGLLRRERRGYRLHYFLDPERLGAYRELTRTLLGEAFVATDEPGHEEEVRKVGCRKERECEHPERKEGTRPCSPEQVERCHGHAQGHPCKSEAEKREAAS
jgi:ArsR family transcriptional regulator, arsenate/arsenite/antimonite-responsive transcriptional repressor